MSAEREMQLILDDIRAKWEAFKKTPNGVTIAGCIAGMEEFEKLDKKITLGRGLPTDWK
ncbi:hypothetical protein SEA_YABOI_285 [Streptomyces phage Yaboi]|uniref:Uncharacterized protein n=3 Tax=Streptomyces virus Yaboi TaxID=2846408 RepID=A0A411CFQ2_9CAUD|nr:hypothetical protein HWB86_gp025 [Streptomyces phage Yaboi]YP_009841376.1 hypothetical protein HWB86_gp042 [Streptomyces phage Yaboi]QAY08687.1 hypothetical protein SEA_GENIE2_25 [Streptomyces phage Genie2]QAY12677.1 hypothetical protein SEA_BOOMERJR_25 [Streptomyces phage BoomerJR]UVD39873.1 hypothetical protein SEA_STANIMAL_25 [Streptomyces phage Stanimal]WNM73614.1 hypothetical protein SEA_SOLLERTIA_25 [Streptomyces phage Sollertia]AYB70864.1 hypothetical protein SEA_YABOI_25 [Streptomy